MLPYATTFSAVIEKADTLSLCGMGFGDEQALQVSDVGRHHYKTLKARQCGRAGTGTICS